MALNIKSTGDTLQKLIDLLRSNQAFCYTRFGDSQLMAMYGWPGHDHEQRINDKLQILQQKAIGINDPDYLVAPSCGYDLEPGMRSGVFALYRNDAELVAMVEKYAKANELWHCEAIHYGMLYNQEKTKEVFNEINKHEVLIVGGEDLAGAQVYFPKTLRYVKIPMDNAFSTWEKTLSHIYSFNPSMVLLSCGLTSQVLQYFMFLDKPHITTINMGSVFNALLEITTGIHSRAWIAQSIEEIKNFKKLL